MFIAEWKFQDFKEPINLMTSSSGMGEAKAINEMIVEQFKELNSHPVTVTFIYGERPQDSGDVDPNLFKIDDSNRQRQLAQKIEEIKKIAEECIRPDWDSMNAESISNEIITAAQLFLEYIPSDIELPEIMPEPDGDINFEWYKAKDYVFSVSISDAGILHFAGKYGDHDRIHGASVFSDSIPNEILDQFRKFQVAR